MNNKGYTITDLLIVIAIIIGLALITLPKASYALKEADNKDEVYSEILSDYVRQAEKYGKNNIDKIGEDGYIISIDELIKEGYVGAYINDGNIIDIRDNTTKMNNIKIKLTYNKENDEVKAELVK